MSLSIGIVGLPNVGKSTLFNALTKNSVPAENYPFCTIDPSVGIVPVPDERLNELSILSKSKKTIPAVVEFIDIAGLVKGASEGEGLGNKFLSHIREVSAIAEILRIFEDDNVIHVNGTIDPLSDINVINLELILADMQTVSKKMSNLSKELKSGKKEAGQEHEILEKVFDNLKNGILASKIILNDKDMEILRSLHLLTLKPILYVLNKKKNGNNLDEHPNDRYKKLLDFLNTEKAMYTIVDAETEQEMKDFNLEDKILLRDEKEGSGVEKLIVNGYELLNLITFFTTGEDETRAWTIVKGSTAPIAGAAIHTDFRDKFIKAEVIPYDELMRVEGYSKAKEKGLLRTEGKSYIVKDGDVIEFKI